MKRCGLVVVSLLCINLFTTGAKAQTSADAPAACALAPYTVHLKWGTRELPLKGHMVVEAHYATSESVYRCKSFPCSAVDGILQHLQTSCDLLKAIIPIADCMNEVYPLSQLRKWTPPEGRGRWGQGSVGVRPDAYKELWLITMYWQSTNHRPEPDTKFLICNETHQCLVGVAGYETGPFSRKFMGGAVPEVHWYLNSNQQTTLTIGYLQDQTLTPGPIDCAGKEF